MNAAAPLCYSRREPLSEYLDRTEFVSSSALRRFARTGVAPGPDFKPPPVPKEAALGDALHALLLEPERFEEDYFEAAAGPVGAKPADPGTLMGRTWLSVSACSALVAMRRSVLQHRLHPLGEWLASGEKELSIYWRDPVSGGWKVRPDCVAGTVLLELKTTSDVRPKQFAKARKRFGYDIQAALYREGVRRLTGRTPRFLYVAVESVSPYSVWIHEPGDAELADADRELAELKMRFGAARQAAMAAV